MLAPAENSKLFQPIQVGDLTLRHRIVHAPVTRNRADEESVHHEIAVEYYSQRASTPGTLLIAEATFVSPKAGGLGNMPGLYNEAQIQGWKQVTDAVHAKGSYIFVQLWAEGRAGDPVLQRKVGYDIFAPSSIPLTGKTTPRALTTTEIKGLVVDWTIAAQNAIRAGFDGVEVHCANGYLLDQFLQDMTNQRTDEYGGSEENRTRFPREVISAVSAAIGESRTGLRISPWGRFNEMCMKNPMPTFTHLVKALVKEHPNLAYLSVVESEMAKPDDFLNGLPIESNEPLRQLWQPRPYISGGVYTMSPERAIRAADEENALVAYGRAFISNPDLVERIRNGLSWTPYDTTTFYSRGPTKCKGYTDYPFASEAAERDVLEAAHL